MENLDYEPGGRKSSKNPEKQSRKRDSNKDEEQQRKNKKENRKSTPSAMPSSGGGGISSSHGSPSRAAEKSSSGNGNQKRRDPQPSGVGAVGGRGSILHNTVNPLLTEVRVLSCCLALLYTLCCRTCSTVQINECQNLLELMKGCLMPGIFLLYFYDIYVTTTKMIGRNACDFKLAHYYLPQPHPL